MFDPYIEHKNMSMIIISAVISYDLLKELLEECGITKIKRVIKGFEGIPFIPDCLHIKGVKKY